MPVVGSPLTSSPSSLTVAPVVTRVEGVPVPAKTRSIPVVQGQLATIDWNMVDRTGNAVDLSSYESSAVVRLNVREALSFSSGYAGTNIGGAFTDPATGGVSATLTAPAVARQGIYVAEFSIWLEGALVFTNWFYLVVEPSLGGATLAGNRLSDLGTPTLAEIRLYLRDVDPAGNLWVADYEWDAAELAAAIVRPIREFNETPPPLAQVWNTSNFPWRHNWLLAICGYLARISADWYRRVHLPYQAGGVSLDDKQKFEQYDQRGQELLTQWREWIRFKKIQINCEGAYCDFPSPYAWTAYGWW